MKRCVILRGEPRDNMSNHSNKGLALALCALGILIALPVWGEYEGEDVFYDPCASWYHPCYFCDGDEEGEDLSDSIPIGTIEELQKIGNDADFPSNGTYHLTQDIDASITSTWNDGTGFKPLHTFSGSLDGRGYALRGLFIHRLNDWPVGLFTDMSGKVERLSLLNGSVTGNLMVGGLAGMLNGHVDACRVSMNVSGSACVGVVAGMGSGIITRCSVQGSAFGTILVGGIAGNGGDLYDSWSSASVTGAEAVGGLFGDSSGVIVRSYAAGSVISWLGGGGGLVSMGDTLVVKDGSKDRPSCAAYWSPEMTGQETSRGGEVRAISELQDEAAYLSMGWDLDKVWAMSDGDTFPYLRNIDPDPAYTSFTFETAVEGSGAVEIAEGEAPSYPAQSFLTLTAVPDTGQRFIAWKGTGLPGMGWPANPLRVVVTDNTIITAVFAPETILINTIEELQLIGKDAAHPLRGSYRLTADIDASDTVAWNDGAGFAPIGDSFCSEEDLVWMMPFVVLKRYPFLGTLDGAGHRISGLTINRPEQPLCGLFGVIGQGGIVQDLTLEDACVLGYVNTGAVAGVNAGKMLRVDVSGMVKSGNGKNVYLVSWVIGNIGGVLSNLPYFILGSYGALTGWNMGVIQGSTVSADIIGSQAYANAAYDFAHYTGTNAFFGGLAGANDEGGAIEGCRSHSRVSGGYFAGGLTGVNMGGIDRSYSNGVVETGNMMGGLAGRNEGSVADAYSLAMLTGGKQMGGLTGDNRGSIYRCYAATPIDITRDGQLTAGLSAVSNNGEGVLVSSFWDTEISGESVGVSDMEEANTGLTTAEMHQEAPFIAAGWDFAGVWGIQESVSYPYLQEMEPASEPERFALNVAIAEQGTVDVSPQYAEYARNSVVALTAHAAEGYLFVGWYSEGLLKEGAPQETLRVIMDRNWSITAQFAPRFREVNTKEDLQRIGHDPAWPSCGNYALTADLDMSEAGTWNNGKGFLPIGSEDRPFTGTFDGRSFAISNLHIASSSSSVGLFGVIGPRGKVSGLELAISVDGETDGPVGGIAGINHGGIWRCHLTSSVTGRSDVGGIAGRNMGTIACCSCASASINGTQDNIGGLAGYNKGLITHCSSEASVSGGNNLGGAVGENMGTVEYSFVSGGAVTCSLAGECIGGFAGKSQGALRQCGAVAPVYADSASFVGGLVGNQRNGSISDCFAQGPVQGGAYVGGLAGTVYDADVLRTYAAGAVSGSTGVGGEAGSVNDPARWQASRWDMDTSGQSTSAAGEGFSTGAMKQTVTYTSAGWDFETVWAIEEGQGYPSLRRMAQGNSPCETLEEGEILMENPHSGDQNADGQIVLTELLRVIQFFNSGGYRCSSQGVNTEDGFEPGPGDGHACGPHSSDYAPQDWAINLTELLRLIQFFNVGGYHDCPDGHTEDGFCVNAV